MNEIVKKLVNWLQFLIGDTRELEHHSIPFRFHVPKEWEPLIPDIAEDTRVSSDVVWLAMSKLNNNQDKDMSPIEVYMIVTDAIEEFKRS
jgi:hypothetical protein